MRKIDHEKVKDLASSIATIGLLNPITISPESTLISGLHRIMAYKMLGKSEIEATIVEREPLLRSLCEIDENLMRNELDDIELGEHLIRRDEILEALGQRYKRGDNQHTGPEIISGPQIYSTEEIGAQLGITGRSARMKKQIARELNEEVRERLKGTPWARSTTGLLILFCYL